MKLLLRVQMDLFASPSQPPELISSERQKAFGEKQRTENGRSFIGAANADLERAILGSRGRPGRTSRCPTGCSECNEQANGCRHAANPRPTRITQAQDGTAPSSHITNVIGAPSGKPERAPPRVTTTAGVPGAVR